MKQSEKWDGEYKRVYPCEGRWEGEDHLEGLGERRRGMARWLWSWGIGDRYLEQKRRAKPRKHEEKERRESVEEGELKDMDRQGPPREGSQVEEMQWQESEKAREERRRESPHGR